MLETSQYCRAWRLDSMKQLLLLSLAVTPIRIAAAEEKPRM